MYIHTLFRVPSNNIRRGLSYALLMYVLPFCHQLFSVGLFGVFSIWVIEFIGAIDLKKKIGSSSMANANVMTNYKNRLQEYTMKRSLDLPAYETVNEGFDHLPRFKSYVTVNAVRYQSSSGHLHKKEAEQSAAKVAVENLVSNASAYRFEETLGKKLLSELLVKLGIIQVPPKFFTTKTGAAHSPNFTSIVEINGASYVGGEAKNKKEAETKAAFEAFQAIKAQFGEPFPQLQLHVELNKNGQLEQPIQECKDVVSEAKAITNESTPKNVFLNGTNSERAEIALETSKVDNPSVEMGSGKSNANESGSACVSLPRNQLEQEASLVQQAQVKTESGIVQNQEHGPNEMEEKKKQGVPRTILTESINKRSRGEPETWEQMGKSKKKTTKNKFTSINSSDTSPGN